MEYTYICTIKNKNKTKTYTCMRIHKPLFSPDLCLACANIHARAHTKTVVHTK